MNPILYSNLFRAQSKTYIRFKSLFYQMYVTPVFSLASLEKQKIHILKKY